MAQYKITKVSVEEPRKWDNPKGGTIFYIKTLLEGHDRPVSIGKKSPDALKVGDTVYGTINPDPEHPEDKFKADPPQFGGGQTSFGGSSKPPYIPKDEAAIKAMWAIGQVMNYMGNAVPEGKVVNITDDFLENVTEAASRLFIMVDRVKGSTDTKADEPMPEYQDDGEVDVSQIPF